MIMAVDITNNKGHWKYLNPWYFVFISIITIQNVNYLDVNKPLFIFQLISQ